MSVLVGIGQMGVQTQKSIWQVLCEEHGVDYSGQLLEIHEDIAIKNFFAEQRDGKWVPVGVFADLEPGVTDVLLNGSMKNLWKPNSIVSGMEGASSNYALGKFQGQRIFEEALQALFRATEAHDYVFDITKISAMSGGTGSGFASLLFTETHDFLPKASKHSFQLLPSQHVSTNTVAPFNACFGIMEQKNCFDLVFNFDNEGLYRPCRDRNIPHPTYDDVNQLLAQVYNGICHPKAFESVLDCSPLQLRTNLVPFPVMNQAIANWGPCFQNSERGRECANEFVVSKERHQQCPGDMLVALQEVLQTGHDWISSNSCDNKYIGCAFAVRGPTHYNSIKNCIDAVSRQSKLQHVEWSPNPYKIGLSPFSAKFFPGSTWAFDDQYVSVTRFANNVCICDDFQTICKNFDLLFMKRSFVHHYENVGVELESFRDARESFNHLIDAYNLVDFGIEAHAKE